MGPPAHHCLKHAVHPNTLQPSGSTSPALQRETEKPLGSLTAWHLANMILLVLIDVTELLSFW